MQVDRVHYERRMSDGNYGNRSMSASAQVDEGESPSEILMMLRDVVVERLTEDQERERQEEEARWDAERAAREARWDAEREQLNAALLVGEDDDDEGEVG